MHDQADALVIGPNSFFNTVEITDQLAGLTLRNKVPAISTNRGFTAAGVLMSYGAAFLQAGIYTGGYLRVRNGPICHFNITASRAVINLKTAKALGIAIPATLLARADEVIE